MFRLLVCLAMIASFSEAWAHRFSVAFILPMSGPDQGSGRKALEGFLYAATEEDAHAFQESDGHLGGLDVYVYPVDSALGRQAMLRQVEIVLVEQEPVFVSGLFDVEEKRFLEEAIDHNEAILLDPVDSAMWRFVLATRDELALLSGDNFSTSFQDRYGYRPNLFVFRGYVAARLISATLRTLAGTEPVDLHKVAEALDQVMDGSLQQ